MASTGLADCHGRSISGQIFWPRLKTKKFNFGCKASARGMLRKQHILHVQSSDEPSGLRETFAGSGPGLDLS